MRFVTIIRAAAAAAGTGLASIAASAGPTYTFQNVADSTGDYDSFGFFAPIDAAGQVRFAATLDDGSQGVFTGADPSAGAIARTGGAFSSIGQVAGNAGGTVAFVANLTGGGQGVFTAAPGQAPQVLADTNGAFQSFTNPGNLSIGNSGKVAFDAQLKSGPRGLFTGPNPATDAVVLTQEGGGAFKALGGAVKVAGDRVYFVGDLRDNTIGIYKGPDPIADVVINGRGAYDNIFPYFDANAAGQVVFFARPDAGGPAGIFTGPNPATDVLATNGGFPYSDIFGAMINDAGQIVFAAETGNSEIGVFAGPDAAADRIVATGDSLFGGTVAGAVLRGLNDRGQVSFTYVLEDGRSGIGVATPSDDGGGGGGGPTPIPLPPALPAALTVLAPLGLLHAARRRRRQLSTIR